VKILIVVVALAALGAVVGAITIGARLKEPTVVADPYQAGLHYDDHRHEPVSARQPLTPTLSPLRGAREMKPSPSNATSSPACDLQVGPCKQPLPGGGEVTLAVGPRPARAMRDLEFTVTFAPASVAVGADVAVALSMPGMYMGETRAVLAPFGEGVFRGKGVVVRCASGRRDWSADVLVSHAAEATPGERVARRVARFPLTVAE
jgi:hypothetical protein